MVGLNIFLIGDKKLLFNYQNLIINRKLFNNVRIKYCLLRIYLIIFVLFSLASSHGPLYAYRQTLSPRHK